MFSIKAGGANLGESWVSWGPLRTAVGYRGIALQFKSLKDTTVEIIQCICQEEFLQFLCKIFKQMNFSHHYEFVCQTWYKLYKPSIMPF